MLFLNIHFYEGPNQDSNRKKLDTHCFDVSIDVLRLKETLKCADYNNPLVQASLVCPNFKTVF